jgi:hypothetical protein
VHVLGDAVSLLGSPLIPCLFLVLGANLAEGPGAAQVGDSRAGLVLPTARLHGKTSNVRKKSSTCVPLFSIGAGDSCML